MQVVYSGEVLMLPTHSRHAARSDTSWLRCHLYRMVGNLVIFTGTNFRKTGQNSGFRNFAVLIFAVAVNLGPAG